MPGVPSGRGCSECRRVKKKCDQLKPSCSRCRRLNVECVGGGQRRFKFVEATGMQHESSLSTSDNSDASRSATPVSKGSRKGSQVSLSPSNSASQLVSTLAITLSRSDDERFSLVNAFGPFLQYVPSRLGKNPALDASVECLLASHSNMCRGGGDSLQVLGKYTNALAKLRTSLDDPVVASSTETLCATMILCMTQSFSGDYQPCSSVGHVSGMARIMKYRGNFQRSHEDEFERELLATLRGPVVFEALWNETIDFTDEEWNNVSSHYQVPGAGPEYAIMLCASRLPIFQRRGRRVLWQGVKDPTLVSDLMASYDLLRLSQGKFGNVLKRVQQRFTDGEIDYATFFRAHSIYVRLHGLGMSIVSLYGCVISAIHPGYTSLEQDMQDTAREVLQLTEKLKPSRPLGASIVPICLFTSMIGTLDMGLRKQLEMAFLDFIPDPSVMLRAKAWVTEPDGMQDMENKLRLRQCTPPACAEFSSQ